MCTCTYYCCCCLYVSNILQCDCLHVCHGSIAYPTDQVQEYVMNGPNEEEGLCVDCKGFSRGVRCSSCVDGYYDSNVGGKDVVCIQ